MNKRCEGYANKPADAARVNSQRDERVPHEKVHDLDNPDRTDDDEHRLQLFCERVHRRVTPRVALYRCRISAPRIIRQHYRDRLRARRNRRERLCVPALTVVSL